MRVFVLLALYLVAVTAVPSNPQRIVGGSVPPNFTPSYPSIASLLFTWNWSTYVQTCAGTIINNRAVLTAAHCVYADEAGRWRIRVGATWANSGGIVHNVIANIVHGGFNYQTMENNLAILRSASTFFFNNNVRNAPIAGVNYVIPENDFVVAAGWGDTYYGSNAGSAQLLHVTLVLINHDTCSYNYAGQGMTITGEMLCAGWPTGGRGQCRGDDGGPLFHNDVLIGVYSFGFECGLPDFPGVNVRVSRYTSWISSNA